MGWKTAFAVLGFGLALIVAAAAGLPTLYTPGLDMTQEQAQALKVILWIALTVGSLIIILAPLTAAIAWIWHYLHTVSVIGANAYVWYWPEQQRTEAPSVKLWIRGGAGPIKITCHVQLGDNEFKSCITVGCAQESNLKVSYPLLPQDINFTSDP